VAIGFADLFYFGEHSQINKIWKDGENRDALVQLIYDQSVSSQARFLAAEVLRNYNVPLKEDAFGLLAEAYTAALTNTAHATGSDSYGVAGNSWGKLTPDYVGFLGQEIIRFGEAAVPYLIPLLDDESPISFDGSKEATTAAMYRFRVNDFAAFYLSAIRNIPINRSTDPETRNKEIVRLKKILAEGKNGQK
jgi:hypothetical protein